MGNTITVPLDQLSKSPTLASGPASAPQPNQGKTITVPIDQLHKGLNPASAPSPIARPTASDISNQWRNVLVPSWGSRAEELRKREGEIYRTQMDQARLQTSQSQIGLQKAEREQNVRAQLDALAQEYQKASPEKRKEIEENAMLLESTLTGRWPYYGRMGAKPASMPTGKMLEYMGRAGVTPKPISEMTASEWQGVSAIMRQDAEERKKRISQLIQSGHAALDREKGVTPEMKRRWGIQSASIQRQIGDVNQEIQSVLNPGNTSDPDAKQAKLNELFGHRADLERQLSELGEQTIKEANVTKPSQFHVGQRVKKPDGTIGVVTSIDPSGRIHVGPAPQE